MKSLNQFRKNLIGIIIFLVVIIFTIAIMFNYLTTKSFYKEEGEIKVKGINNPVRIYKDLYGVPFIEAKGEDDMYFSLGYIHAQDRLWQMDIFRRIGEGRLAEIFGNEAVEYDKMFKTLALNELADNLWNKLSDHSKRILLHYCEGVNYFITQHKSSLPFEFDVLNYKPELWKPQHSLLVIRLMGWELNLSWYTDYTFGQIVKKFGFEKSLDFFPLYPEDSPFIIHTETKPSKASLYQNTENYYNKLVDLGEEYFNSIIKFRNYVGIEGTHIGSNCWVVNGDKTETKKPLLANDPHLALTVPAKWYEVSLSNTESDYLVSGFSIPGSPGIAIGMNNYIAWGITNLMNDDADFYLLKYDSLSKDFKLGNKHYKIDTVISSIKVKNQKDELYYTSYKTELGPVVSNLEKTGFTNQQSFKTPPSEVLVMKWTGYEMSDEIKCFYELSKAKNWKEFRQALQDFNLPASNFCYADIDGNIGYQVAGKIPIRKGAVNENVYMFPVEDAIEWVGFVPFEELPSAYNPKTNFIVTANNKPLNNYKYYISNLYEPPYRAQRIEEILAARNNFTAQEFQLIQNDLLSNQAKEFLSYLFKACENNSQMSTIEIQCLNLLKNWDYEFKTFSVQATIFAEFEAHLYKNIYESKLGNELYRNYIFLKNIPVRTTAKLLKENKSWLLEFQENTTKIDGRAEILKKSFSDAVLSLSNLLGEDVSKWQWGEIHKIIMKHPLGNVSALSRMLNIGPFDIGGSGTTVNNLEYPLLPLSEKSIFESNLGASMRFVVDFSNVGEYYSVLSTGQSGQPQHKNYKDQSKLWLNGEYKKVLREKNKIINEKLLVLSPL